MCHKAASPLIYLHGYKYIQCKWRASWWNKSWENLQESLEFHTNHLKWILNLLPAYRVNTFSPCVCLLKKFCKLRDCKILWVYFSFILTEYSPFLLCPSRNKRKNLVLFSQLINLGRRGISSKYIMFLTLWFRLILRRVRWVACQCWSQQSVTAFLPEASLAQNGDSTPSTHLRGVRKEKKWSHEKMRKLSWPDKCPRLS